MSSVAVLRRLKSCRVMSQPSAVSDRRRSSRLGTRQFLDHEQFGDPSQKKTGIDHRKSLLLEHVPQVTPVGKALKALGDVAIDFMIAMKKDAP
jgi:hypothetical protein